MPALPAWTPIWRYLVARNTSSLLWITSDACVPQLPGGPFSTYLSVRTAHQQNVPRVCLP